MPRNHKRLQNVYLYLRTEIWRRRLADMPRLQAFAVRQLRVLVLAIGGFIKDNCALRASALTFYTLLSVVPVAAMAFGIAKGFGMSRMLQTELLKLLPGQEEIVFRIIDFAEQALATVRGGVIAGIGIIILLYTVLKVLNSIEDAFNSIWGVNTHRSMVRKFADYLSMMFIAPVLVILSSSLTVWITAEVTMITRHYSVLEYIGPFIFALIQTLPYALVWLLFTLLYVLMPNTQVRLRSAFVAGIIAGSSYQIAQWIYVSFQFGAARYNAIYGSFAALPLFLIWLQISWLIVLFGAEISYAHQNADMHEHEPDYANVSPHYNKLIALQIAHLLVKRFMDGKTALTSDQISHRLEMPIRLVETNLGDMVDKNIVSTTQVNGEKGVAYQPARDVHYFTVKSVIDALEMHGVNQLPIAETPELEKLRDIIHKFDALVESSPDNLALKDL